jgi:hypothetical protein
VSRCGNNRSRSNGMLCSGQNRALPEEPERSAESHRQVRQRDATGKRSHHRKSVSRFPEVDAVPTLLESVMQEPLHTVVKPAQLHNGRVTIRDVKLATAVAI